MLIGCIGSRAKPKRNGAQLVFSLSYYSPSLNNGGQRKNEIYHVNF
jgi:hypothetical protein